MDYFPLRIAQHMEMLLTENKLPVEWGNLYAHQRDYFCQMFKVMTETDMDSDDMPETEEEFMTIIMSYEMMEHMTAGKYPKLKEGLYGMLPFVVKTAGYTKTDLQNNPRIDVRTELRDLFGQTLLLERWVMDKQVLKPDPTFAYHLIQTDKLIITKYMLEHLPMYNFYIDMQKFHNDPEIRQVFGDINGIFVHIIKIDENHYTIAFYIVFDKSDENKKDPYLTFSFYTFLTFDESNNYEFNVDTSIFTEFENPKIVKPMRNKFKNMSENIPHRNLKVFVLQLLCYMSVSEPDIIPDPSMKFSYKPNPSKIKNKFKEVYIQDVGIKIGAVITKRKKEAEESIKNEQDTDRKTNAKRKPPSAHYRRAHWHHFWTGKGRTTPIIKWIEPTFVCGVQSANITIHKVK